MSKSVGFVLICAVKTGLAPVLKRSVKKNFLKLYSYSHGVEIQPQNHRDPQNGMDLKRLDVFHAV